MPRGLGRPLSGAGPVPIPALRIALAALAIGLAGMVAGGCGKADGGDRPEITVLGASSLQSALTAYGESLTGTELRQSFAGSDLLAAQIRNGARPDVYAAADTALPDRLFREGLIERPRVFASNRLAVAVPAGSGIDGLADLAEPDRSVILGDRGVPIGIYADRVLAKLPPGERDGILANVGSREPEASSITAKLVQGAADAGIVYRTDIRTAGESLDDDPDSSTASSRRSPTPQPWLKAPRSTSSPVSTWTA